MENIRPPEPFAFEEPNAPQRWTRWQKQFKTYFVAAELDSKTKEVQVARLLNAAGPEAQEIHELFVFDAEGDEKEYTKVLEKFTEYCRPKKNVVYERFKFWSRSQKEGESFDPWIKDLRIIAKDCEFAEEDNMIRDKIVFGVYDTKVQERMLRKNDLTLKDAADTCRAAESSQNQIAEMRKRDAPSYVNAVEKTQYSGASSQVKCFKCQGIGHFARNCTAKVETKPEETSQVKCFNCKGWGHMSRECPSGDSYPKQRKKKVGRGRSNGGGGNSTSREMNEVEDYEMDEYVQEFSSLSLHAVSLFSDPGDAAVHVSTVNEAARKRFVKIRFHDPATRTYRVGESKIDSGAGANVMPLKIYKELYPGGLDARGYPLCQYVRKSQRKLEAYGGVEVPNLGTVNVPCQLGTRKFMCRFFLCDISGSMLLGLPTCEALGIVKINPNGSDGRRWMLMWLRRIRKVRTILRRGKVTLVLGAPLLTVLP